MSKKPHIIIFNPDQMRSDALSHLGNPASITPNLDRMAANEAVSFRNAFCQNPVCVPSRCSFMTGLYPHTLGHRTMSYHMREGESTLLQELKNDGYYVWANARNDLIAGQIPGLIESHVSELYYGGNSKQAPGNMNPNPRGKPGDISFYSFHYGELKVDERGKNYTSDDEDIDAAVQRILNPVDDRPLCISLGLQYPHPPYQVEEPYFSAINRNSLPKRILPDDQSGKSRMLELLRKYQNLSQLTEVEWDEMRATYLGMCMKVDEQFGRLCDALKQAGIYDDSAIFFFSDHGDYTGDFGISEKTQNTFEDCVSKVPLLIKPPAGIKTDPGVSNGLVELVDFYATALDFAGIQSPHSHFGLSLRDVLSDRSLEHRSFVTCEGGRLASETHCNESDASPVSTYNPYWPRRMAQMDDQAHAKGTMIRTSKSKYIFRHEDQDEFYDLDLDPYEEKNLIDSPAYAGEIAKLRLDLLGWFQDTCDIVPFDHDARVSSDMIWHKVKNLCPSGSEEMVRKKINAGAGLFEIINLCKNLKPDT